MANPTDHVKKKVKGKVDRKKPKKPKKSKIPFQIDTDLTNPNVPTFIPDPDESPFSDPYDLYSNYGAYQIQTNFTRTNLISEKDEYPYYLTRGSSGEKVINSMNNMAQNEQVLNLLTIVKDYGVRLAGNIGPWDLGIFGQGNPFTMSTGSTTPVPLGKLFDET